MANEQGLNYVDMIVVGGGAAGFFGALRAASLAPDARVLLLEGSKSTLAKVRISGGGRCNVTHACFDPAELASRYPRGQKELLGPFHKFGPGDTIQWFESRGVPLKTEADGRMFPVSDSSESIASCLETEARRTGVQVITQRRVRTISKEEGRFTLTCADGSRYSCHQLLVATGGQPAMWSLMQELGHEVVAPVPSLFTFHVPANGLKALAGIALPDAVVRACGQEARGPLLITHEGLSGPATLKLSAWAARAMAGASYRTDLEINWLGKDEETFGQMLEAMRQQEGKKAVGSHGLGQAPQRLWRWLVEQAGLDISTRWGDMRAEQVTALREVATAQRLRMTGKSTFQEEFVTAGGVSLKEMDLRTFASRKVESLFLAGEMLDIDAVTGGFNFQAAWTGGWLAGSEMGKRWHQSQSNPDLFPR